MTKKLTLKTFLLLAALSLSVCLAAYGCIKFYLPYADKHQAQKTLEKRTARLTEELCLSGKKQSEALFLEFIRETGARLTLQNSKGQNVSLFTFEPSQTGSQVPFTENPANDEITERTKIPSIQKPFKFADTGEEYLLTASFHPSRTMEISDAIRHSLPFVAAVTILLSFAGAWFFSHYTTRPILRIHRIARKMAELDFSWYCPDMRDDEIGMLSKSINELSDRLHEALNELQQRNTALSDEIQIEKERERRRMLFFSGISHELKTPIAIVTGQLEGMQANIGVYRDRDKYLARSAEILRSLSQFIKEILLVSQIDLADRKSEHPVSISCLLNELLQEYGAYAEFSSIRLHADIQNDLYVCGQEPLLKKAAGNIIGNAITHSPEHADVTVALTADRPKIITLCVTNTPAHIHEEHLPHLFEAFYRADSSAEQSSGLGLYITRLILETYHVPYKIENISIPCSSVNCGQNSGDRKTAMHGVKFTASFAEAEVKEL